MKNQNYSLLLGLLGVLGLASLQVGCGTNQFEQEVQTEQAAIKLARETTSGGYQLVSTEELKRMLDDDETFLLVDAMPAESSYDKGHIPGAVNFDFPKEVMESWDEEALGGRTLEDYQRVLGDEMDRPIVVYCGFVKCARSHNAAVFAQELGYTNVYRYPGGIYAWRGAGYALSVE